MTLASRAIDGGAALRASATSAAWLAIAYCASGAMTGYFVLAVAAPPAPSATINVKTVIMLRIGCSFLSSQGGAQLRHQFVQRTDPARLVTGQGDLIAQLAMGKGQFRAAIDAPYLDFDQRRAAILFRLAAERKCPRHHQPARRRHIEELAMRFVFASVQGAEPHAVATADARIHVRGNHRKLVRPPPGRHALGGADR